MQIGSKQMKQKQKQQRKQQRKQQSSRYVAARNAERNVEQPEVRTETRSSRRVQGRSLVEAVFGLMILGIGMLGIDAMALSRDIVVSEADAKEMALSIAEGQRSWIESLPYEQLRPTQGFEAVSWIETPGLEPGELAMSMTRNGEEVGEAQQVYTVKWMVENVDEWGSLRRVAVAVEWLRLDEQPRRVTVTTLRAGMHAS